LDGGSSFFDVSRMKRTAAIVSQSKEECPAGSSSWSRNISGWASAAAAGQGNAHAHAQP
jgi:hypothetical protein